MSRIRSIHPGQWTDEAFVECSAFARLLALGVRNEADDNGVFEWRPTRLKMRLFPADAIDVAELLGELEERGLVLRFDADDRQYGAIRNFRVYQNPRSPKAEHPITDDAERFVGDRVGDDAPAKRGPGRPRKRQDGENIASEAKSFPQNVENNSVMERERREEDNSPSDSSIGAPIDPPATALVLVHQSKPNDEARAAFDAYGVMRCDLVSNARPLVLSPDRRKQISARLREVGGVAGWATVLSRIRASPFLRGDSDRGGRFIAELDWLLKPVNLRKVMEGNYDERSSSAVVRSRGATSTIDALAEARNMLGFGG